MSFSWDVTLYPFGSGSNAATVPFISGITGNIPVDGSATETITFPTTAAQVPIAVIVQAVPGTLQAQQFSAEVTDVTTSGFNLTVYGGLSGNSCPFYYIALILGTPNIVGGSTGDVLTNGGSVTVTYATAFASETTSVVVSPNPATPTAELWSWEITDVSTTGFTLTVYGGSGGSVPFTYLATGS